MAINLQIVAKFCCQFCLRSERPESIHEVIHLDLAAPLHVQHFEERPDVIEIDHVPERLLYLIRGILELLEGDVSRAYGSSNSIHLTD